MISCQCGPLDAATCDAGTLPCTRDAVGGGQPSLAHQARRQRQVNSTCTAAGGSFKRRTARQGRVMAQLLPGRTRGSLCSVTCAASLRVTISRYSCTKEESWPAAGTGRSGTAGDDRAALKGQAGSWLGPRMGGGLAQARGTRHLRWHRHLAQHRKECKEHPRHQPPKLVYTTCIPGSSRQLTLMLPLLGSTLWAMPPASIWTCKGSMPRNAGNVDVGGRWQCMRQAVQVRAYHSTGSPHKGVDLLAGLPQQLPQHRVDDLQDVARQEDTS